MQAGATADRAPVGTVVTAVVPAAVWRMRVLAVCAALTALAFLQQPGVTVADTKIDLAVNPVGFLERALHLWDPAGTFGQLQNQAYGYLWPMGPFFAAGSAVHIPPWAVERLWWALLLCVAFTGAVKLAEKLHVGTPGARLIAGTAFALSPRILTELGSVSVEAWPSAVAPWVLVPLIGLAHGTSIRRAVSLSALAVACAGGVNATAAFAVVPLAVLWLLSLAPMRRRLIALAAWGFAVLCATAWWLVPLVVLSRYSPPFLNYIETAAATTRLTDPITILRGASYWVAYLFTSFGPVLPAGARLADQPVLIIAAIVVAALGVAGLSRRGMPYRRVLIAGALVGLALVGLGHVSDLPGTFAGAQRAFLDGVGAPLRNVHKFDVLIRLPLTLGLAHLLGLASRAAAVRRGDYRPMRARAVLVPIAAVAAIGTVALPGLTGGLPPVGGFTDVPAYWRQASAWLNANVGDDRVLVVPAARFPDYTWGDTVDEITQPLLTVPSAVRNAIPLTPPTTIRLLDAVESVLATGAGSPGLADVLARSGVKYVLLRSDLDYGQSDTTQPMIVRQALQRSSGLSYVTGFGPMVGEDRRGKAYVDGGLGMSVRALEIYRVDQAVSPVVAYDANDVTTVVGGPESLLDLAAAGQLTSAPTVLAGDQPPHVPVGPLALTDGLRLRNVDFGQGRDNTSSTLAAAAQLPQPAHDYLPSWGDRQATTVQYEGIASLTASSSWADAGSAEGSRPEYQPYAALDGDPTTSWRPDPGLPGAGQWIELQLASPQVIAQVTVQFDVTTGALPTKITITAGADQAIANTFNGTTTIKLPGLHATRTVRLTVDQELATRPGAHFGIAEIEIPGLRAGRTLVVPAPPVSADPATLVFTAAPSVPGCFFPDGQVRCSAAVARASEDDGQIDRTVTLGADSGYTPTIWATPRPGPALDALLDQEMAAPDPYGLAPAVVASSTAVDDPAGRPGAALDGDPTTAWAPAATDANPFLRLTWLKPRIVTGIQLRLDSSVAATQPGVVRVIGDNGIDQGFLDTRGLLTFDKPLVTRELTIFVLDPPHAQSFDPYTLTTEPLPIAVGELTVLPDKPKAPVDLDGLVKLPCGSGPTLTAGGQTIQTKISATVRDLLQLRETVAEPCGPTPPATLSLRPGVQRIVAAPGPLAMPSRVALVPVGSAPAAAETGIRIAAWSADDRRIAVAGDASARILAVRENSNAGWRAVAGGRTLTPIIVDGWQQGWVIPAGYAGDIVLTYTPDATYRAALLTGVILLSLVVVMAALPVRRRGWHAPPPVVERGRGRTVPFVVGAAALVLIGGAVGGILTVAGLVIWSFRAQVPPETRARRRVLHRTLRALELWLPAVALLIGGWLTVTLPDSHRVAAPQLVGLAVFAGLWLSAIVRPVPQVAVRPPRQRFFPPVVAQRGQRERSRQGDGSGQHGAGDGGAIGAPVGRLEHERQL